MSSTVLKQYSLVFYNNEGDIKRVEFNKFLVSAKKFDNCFLLQNGKIIFVSTITHNESGGWNIRGKCFQDKSPFFTSPCDSIMVDIGILNTEGFCEDSGCYTISDIASKCISIEIAINKYLVIPLIHQ